MPYRYYYLLRPFSIGCQPDGYRMVPDEKYPTVPVPAAEVWMPKRDVTLPEGRRIESFGWIEYDEPLPLERVWKYDLHPEDPVEWAHQVFFEFAELDEEKAADWEKWYLEKSNVESMTDRRLALAVKILRENKNAQ